MAKITKGPFDETFKMEDAGAFGERFNALQRQYWVETGHEQHPDDTILEIMVELHNRLINELASNKDKEE